MNKELEHILLRELFLSTQVSVDTKELIHDYQNHECRGAKNAYTWLDPFSRQLWLYFTTDQGVERCTWINYCPYCGYNPKNLASDSDTNIGIRTQAK